MARSPFGMYLDSVKSDIKNLKVPEYIRQMDYLNGRLISSFDRDIQTNTRLLLKRANIFLHLFYTYLELENPLVVWRSGCQGGIRTKESNKEIYRLINEKGLKVWLKSGKKEEDFVPIPEATKSNHIFGLAIDLADKYDLLKKFIALFPEVLELLDLYVEHPDYTDTWLHIQIVKFKSYVAGGTRVFKPY